MLLPQSLLLLALSIFSSTTNAIFADEAGVIDYHLQLLGVPKQDATFFYRPRKDDRASLLYSLSDLGILGAVTPSTGALLWRQVLDTSANNASSGFLRGVEGEGTVVSGLGSSVSAWDATNGRSKWTQTYGGIIQDLEVLETAAGAKEGKDILALYADAEKGILRRLEARSGGIKWEYTEETSDLPLQVSTNLQEIFLVSLHGARGGYNLKVTALDPLTGKKVDEYTLSSKADIHGPEDILLVGANSAAPVVAWTDKAFKEIKVNILGKKAVHTLALKEADGELVKVTLHAPHLTQSLPHFLVYSESTTSNRADVYHIDLKSYAINKAYELPTLRGKGAVSTSSQDANVYFTRITAEEVIIVSSQSHGILGRSPVKVTKDHGSYVHAASEVVARSADVYSVRFAAVTSNDEWVLSVNGAEGWTRVEGLSGAVAADWAELPGEERLAQTLEEEARVNPLTAYVHRVTRHVTELEHLPQYLIDLPKRFLSTLIPGDSTSSDELVRDNFGFNKLVIVATQRGRIYALNAGKQGKVVWTAKAYDVPAGQKWDVKGLWVENKKGLVTVRGASGEYIILRTLTGEVLEKTSPGAWPPTTSTAVVDSASGKWAIPIGVNGDPGNVPVAWAPKDNLVVQGDSGEVRGLKFLADGENSVPVVAWTFQPIGQKIIEIVARPHHDPVASIGRVLGDRTVLYKYLNPNNILVTAASETAAAVSFYLLDSVSGDILYSTTHTGVDTSKSITSTLTENWFAYSLFSDAVPDTVEKLPLSKGYQLVISELYESDIPNDRGPLGASANTSSLEPSDIVNAEPALPYVISQTFLIPAAISHMSVTQTKQGITSRQLLCTLASTNAIIGIPKHVIDPRRPVGRDPTPLEQEEGLFRYQPFIDFDPKMVITHKLDVLGTKKVITSPALLESTSLLFAYGIDIFGTRVTPSAAFDILGKGFNKLSLIGTVVALAVGVVLIAPMSLANIKLWFKSLNTKISSIAALAIVNFNWVHKAICRTSVTSTASPHPHKSQTRQEMTSLLRHTNLNLPVQAASRSKVLLARAMSTSSTPPQPAAGITSLDHLVLTVASIPRTQSWYATNLGMKAESFVAPSSPTVTRHSLRFGAQKINLHELGKEFEPKAQSVKSGSADLCFLTDDRVEEVRERLLGNQVALEEQGDVVERTGARGKIRSVYCRDPDGNLIE
ncbi:duf1620 domain containing protein [Phlyctema vagabunda]|uniref:ER membrane protein complex subunit 1 n=1 Tax=Phlyctema vagabunda TaxID=108571 RepID=A0ABR4P698_9HELO